MDVAPAQSASNRSRVAPKLTPISGLPAIEGEIRALLHDRLRVIGVLAVVGWVTLVGLFGAQADPLLNMETLGTCGETLMALTAAVTAAIGVLLIRRRELSLDVLRRCELVIFGLSGVCLAWIRFATLRIAFREPIPELQFSLAYTSPIGYANMFSNLNWMTLIMVYGVFVPNTWQRTLRIVGTTALVVVAVDVATWGMHAPRVDETAFAPALMTFLTLFMSIGTSVFGSFKISSLQEEAFEARQQMRDLGQYHLKKLLGTGGMGEVYLAEHRLLKRPCAVKLIRPERASDPQILARFEREVQATARLSHPNTVEVYDYGRTDDGTFYYVMEYLDGVGLDELVKRHGPLPPGRAVHIARQLCGALREAHIEGLIHRDIKPGNVLVCRQAGVCDVAKLVDFGLVHNFDEDSGSSKLTREGHIVGTPDYMSPEQANHPDSLDHRTDIYSLGGLIYFMLTGRPPFERKTMLETLFAHQHDVVEPLRAVNFNLPSDLEIVVLRCLAKDADERFPDTGVLDDALKACAAAGEWTEQHAARWWATNLH
jgi:serine/threonine-protein kinase